MDLGIKDRIVIVTGAGGGIGRQIALAFAEMGARVVVCDIDETRAEETFLALESSPLKGGPHEGTPHEGIPLEGHHLMSIKDLSNISQCKLLVEETVEKFGRLDILVNVAAILKRVPIEEVDEAIWDQILNVNLKSQFFLSREACKVMAPNHWGRIINFSSQGGFLGGYATSAVYNITKGAILTLTKSFARSYAADGICVNAIAPGFVDTDMMKMPVEQIQSLLQLVPMKRMGRPDEMVGTVLFLASSWASYITGATIDITGGQLMR